MAGSEYVYSSSYDLGEMWASIDIYPASPLSINFTGLHVASTGPASNFSVGIAGSARNGSPVAPRLYKVELNGSVILDTNIKFV